MRALTAHTRGAASALPRQEIRQHPAALVRLLMQEQQAFPSSCLLIARCLLLGADNQRFQAIGLISLAGRFTDGEIKFGVHRADLDALKDKGGAERRIFGLEDVIDVVVLVRGHEDVDIAWRDNWRKLQPVGRARLGERALLVRGASATSRRLLLSGS